MSTMGEHEQPRTAPHTTWSELNDAIERVMIVRGSLLDRLKTTVEEWIEQDPTWNQPVITFGDPCVECNEPFEPGDAVTWRVRYAPQGLIHRECR